MNSRVSVDAERELRCAEGGGGEVPQDDFEVPPSVAHDGQKGSVVLVLPPKDNLMAGSSTSDDCIPIMVNDVPVYISHTSTGSPLYIRQYPPTLEEIMMRSPEDLIANFDGFSEASGQTFEGFSEASCSSVLFEGFSEDALEFPKFSVIQNLGKMIGKDFEDTTEIDLTDDYDSQPENKSTSRSSRRSRYHGGKRQDSPGRVKRSSSSDTQSQKKRIKQEGTTVEKSITSKSSHSSSQTMTTILSQSRRRQSTEKQEKELPECPVLDLQGKKPRHLPSPEDPDYIGERCNDIGCTVSFLERMAIKNVKITNGIVQELADFASRILWDKEFVARWMQRLSGVRTDEPVEDSDLKSIQTILKRRKALATIHSGNQYVKSKLKSFDDIEFVLPSLAAKGQYKDPEDRINQKSRTIQDTDDETSSMTKLINDPTTHTLLHSDDNDENEQELGPETKKIQVMAEKEKEHGESRKGVKRATCVKENENKRRVSIELDKQQEESTAYKTVEKITKGKEEEKSNKELKQSVDKTRRRSERDQSTRSRRMSAMISQEEKKIVEKDEQQAIRETDKDTKTGRSIGTRRASMMLAKKEKEKQDIANEDTQQVVGKTKRDRRGRGSIVLKQEEEKDDDDNRETGQATDKRKTQINDKEMIKLDNKEHETQPIDIEEYKQVIDRRKEKKTTHGGKEDHCIEGEKEPADKTEKETQAGKRISSRKASMFLAKQEKEKLAAEREKTKQTVGRTKRETSDNRRSSRGTSIRIKSEEDKQGLDHNTEQQTTDRVGEVPVDKKHDKQLKDKKNQVANEEVKANEKEIQVVSGIKMEKKIGTRRVSMLARQEKEKQGNEAEATKQGRETTEGECKRSERISSRRDKGDSGKQDREEKEKENIISEEGRKQTAARSERETGRDKRRGRRASLMITNQEGEEQVTDKEKEKPDAHQEGEMQNTDMPEKQATLKIEKETKRDRRTSKRMSLIAKTKQEEEDDEERENQSIGTKKGSQTTGKEEGIGKDPERPVDKTEKDTKMNRRSRNRRGSMISNEAEERETSDKEDNTAEKPEKEAKNVKTSKRKMKLEEQEMTDKEEEEYASDRESHIDSGEEIRATDKDENKKVNKETQSEKEKQRSANKERNAEIENETESLNKNKGFNEEEEETQKEGTPISVEEQKEETGRSQGNNVRENQDGSSEENQILLKRNKVINKDKRISRWQNRNISKHEEKENSSKEDINLAVKDSPESNESREFVKPEQMSFEDSQNEESDASLVIDEGDNSMQSDVSEHGLQTEMDSSMQSDASYSTPKRKLRSMSKDEVDVDEGIEDRTEDPLLLKVTDFPEHQTEKLKRKEKRQETSSEKITAIPSVLIKEDEELWENQDSKAKEASPQDTTTPEASVKPQGTESSYDGTLGISKSGRLRKASAKGIQSIEIKCLFMQRNSETSRPPPPLPALENEQNDEDWIREKKSPVKQERKDKDPGQEKRSPVKHERKDSVQEKRLPVKHEDRDGVWMPEKKSPLGPKLKKQFYKYRRGDSQYITYTHKDGHLVPKFRETDYYLGDYCAEAGLTVDDLNSDKVKKVKMTFGVIKELHDFYTSRKATKTSLAIRLFKMTGKKILDNTHLLSTVIRLTTVGAIKLKDKERLRREFVMPNRITYRGPPDGEETKGKTQVQPKREAMQVSPGVGASSPRRVRRSPKKRGFKPEDSGDEERYDYGDMEEDEDLCNEILLTRGEVGNITRGDIVHLYTKWLRNKMSIGSNTFVTDLLRNVEQLMAERHITRIRIPAGTLMSCSVRLHDEYKQILRISKEDAVMYLQEDWLEDIKYLLSISGPSRRNTSEGEAAPGGTGEGDNSLASEKHTKGKTGRHRSGGSKEEEICDFKGEPISNTLPFKSTTKVEGSRSHQMESVGKRLGKRRSIRKSLQDYERDILLELEKSGMLEEEEEDVLSQLDREERVSEGEEKKQKEKKERQKKNQKEEKKPEGDKDKNKKKGSTPIKKGKKPVDDNAFEVEKIMDYQEIHDSTGKHLRYFVRWVGFGSEDDSWVDERNLQCPSILEAFWKRRKIIRPDKPQPAMEQDHESPKETEHSKQRYLLKDPKEAEENIIQVMVKHGSAQHAISANKESAIVTKRELLSLYDSWRQENQDDLIAGGSNTVNVEVLKGRVRDLMASRNVEFYPESLLNACFMMTLMKTRLQSKIAIDRFLDTSCLEVLESSHRQYLKRKYSQIEEVPTRKYFKDQKHTVLSLQNELHSLKLDLATAQKWRAVKNSQLGAVEEEVEYLETAAGMSNFEKKTKKIMYFKQELQKLKNDIRILERYQKKDSVNKVAKRIQVPLFGNVGSNLESYKRSSKIIKNKLMNMNISKSTVNTIMDVVARRMSSQLV